MSILLLDVSRLRRPSWRRRRSGRRFSRLYGVLQPSSLGRFRANREGTGGEVDAVPSERDRNSPVRAEDGRQRFCDAARNRRRRSWNRGSFVVSLE
jgi:hypothetical protein